eukprot:1183185-Prorocentrum_minimum.AAC.3
MLACFARRRKTVPGCAGLCWAVLDCAGLCWTVPTSLFRTGPASCLISGLPRGLRSYRGGELTVRGGELTVRGGELTVRGGEFAGELGAAEGELSAVTTFELYVTADSANLRAYWVDGPTFASTLKTTLAPMSFALQLSDPYGNALPPPPSGSVGWGFSGAGSVAGPPDSLGLVTASVADTVSTSTGRYAAVWSTPVPGSYTLSATIGGRRVMARRAGGDEEAATVTVPPAPDHPPSFLVWGDGIAGGRAVAAGARVTAHVQPRDANLINVSATAALRDALAADMLLWARTAPAALTRVPVNRVTPAGTFLTVEFGELPVAATSAVFWAAARGQLLPGSPFLVAVRPSPAGLTFEVGGAGLRAARVNGWSAVFFRARRAASPAYGVPATRLSVEFSPAAGVETRPAQAVQAGGDLFVAFYRPSAAGNLELRTFYADDAGTRQPVEDASGGGVFSVQVSAGAAAGAAIPSASEVFGAGLATATAGTPAVVAVSLLDSAGRPVELFFNPCGELAVAAARNVGGGLGAGFSCHTLSEYASLPGGNNLPAPAGATHVFVLTWTATDPGTYTVQVREKPARAPYRPCGPPYRPRRPPYRLCGTPFRPLRPPHRPCGFPNRLRRPPYRPWG